MLAINMPYPSPRSKYIATVLALSIFFQGRDSTESLMAFEDTEGLLGISKRKGTKLLEKCF